MDFDAQWLKTCVVGRGRAILGVHTMCDNMFGSNFPKTVKTWPSVSTFEPPRTASRRMTS